MRVGRQPVKLENPQVQEEGGLEWKEGLWESQRAERKGCGGGPEPRRQGWQLWDTTVMPNSTGVHSPMTRALQTGQLHQGPRNKN